MDPQLLTPKVLVELGWVAFALVGIVVIPVSVMGGIAFWRTREPAGSFTKMFERAQALKMVTVILIVLSVFFLTLLKFIDSSGATGILSGIAGYVLGGLEKGAGATAPPATPGN